MEKVLDILNLIYDTKLHPNDSFTKLLYWYSWALEQRLIETVYEKDKLLGFLCWVKLKNIPKDMNIEPNYDVIKTASVLFVTTIAVRSKSVIWKLKKKLLDKNKDYDFLCWHSKRRDCFVTIKNWRLMNV